MEKTMQLGLHNLYSSGNVIRMIKSRKMRWEGNVASMGKMRNAYTRSFGRPMHG
jgi:hypothetical protein